MLAKPYVKAFKWSFHCLCASIPHFLNEMMSLLIDLLSVQLPCPSASAPASNRSLPSIFFSLRSYPPQSIFTVPSKDPLCPSHSATTPSVQRVAVTMSAELTDKQVEVLTKAIDSLSMQSSNNMRFDTFIESINSVPTGYPYISFPRSIELQRGEVRPVLIAAIILHPFFGPFELPRLDSSNPNISASLETMFLGSADRETADFICALAALFNSRRNIKNSLAEDQTVSSSDETVDTAPKLTYWVKGLRLGKTTIYSDNFFCPKAFELFFDPRLDGAVPSPIVNIVVKVLNIGPFPDDSDTCKVLVVDIGDGKPTRLDVTIVWASLFNAEAREACFKVNTVVKLFNVTLRQSYIRGRGRVLAIELDSKSGFDTFKKSKEVPNWENDVLPWYAKMNAGIQDQA